MHASHIVAAHTAGHFIVANIRFGEGMVDHLRGAGRNGIQTDKHMIVLIVFVHRCPVGIGWHEGESVCLLALVGYYEIIGNTNVKYGD